MKDLRKKWGHFLGLVFSPWSLIFIGATVVSLILSATLKDNIALSNLLAVIGSITGGIAGGIFQHEYGKTHDQNILEKKGRSALRNLDSIGEQIAQLRGWIESFKKNVGKEGNKSLEEIERHLSTITFNISAGVADWIDVVPELQERVEVAKKTEEVLKTYLEELLDNKKELIVSKDEKRVSELKTKITDLEKQIKKIQMESRSVTRSGRVYQSQPLAASSVWGAVNGSLTRCEKCGNYFSPGTGLTAEVCPFCQNGGVAGVSIGGLG